MAVELKVPSLGESITEVMIGTWYKNEGDLVAQDEPLVEIETDKTTVDLPAPAPGQLSRILKKKGEVAAVGEVIGYLEEQGVARAKRAAREASRADSPAPAAAEPAKPEPAAEPAPSSPPPVEAPAAPAEPEPAPAAETPAASAPKAAAPPPEQAAPAAGTAVAERVAAAAVRIMPAAERLIAQHGLDPATIRPSGPGGRILKEDVLRAIEARRAADESASAPAAEPAAPRPAPAPAPGLGEDRPEEVVPMTFLRRRIAERLVQAQHEAALLTTFNEVDMGPVKRLREQYQPVFREKYGIKLGFMSFFVKAVIDALKLVPEVNAEIRGTDIVYKNYYDIGVAVGGGRGLVVPVIRNAERLSFAEIELTIADFAQRAKNNTLKLEELQGGTFTISNGGVYGSLLSTPIVNPPQTGILGMHAIQDRPVAVEGRVEVRPMMYIALTYDHRLIDGREAVTFLRRIKECVEEPTRMLLEV
ncbi:MAG: 2-oxoglutarate dehydrogenase complex dihydrolipoyllysine-residue succinyltransferase [Acidobacteria bacterium]|nr:MAG: 2-oxoglutarate dehydrogenase complex dihydrolipoyllysine-residue succinyltransferase [Acidobacteriota bacterium]